MKTYAILEKKKEPYVCLQNFQVFLNDCFESKKAHNIQNFLVVSPLLTLLWLWLQPEQGYKQGFIHPKS